MLNLIRIKWNYVVGQNIRNVPGCAGTRVEPRGQLPDSAVDPYFQVADPLVYYRGRNSTTCDNFNDAGITNIEIYNKKLGLQRKIWLWLLADTKEAS